MAVCGGAFPPLSGLNYEFGDLLDLSLTVMSWVVKHALTVPGTLARLRQGAAPTVPRTPVAWQRREREQE